MTGINCIEYQHGQSRELVRISRYSMISEHMIRSNWTLPHFSKKSSIFVHAGYFRKKGSHCCHYTNKNQMVKWWAAQLTSDQQLLKATLTLSSLLRINSYRERTYNLGSTAYFGSTATESQQLLKVQVTRKQQAYFGSTATARATVTQHSLLRINSY